MPIQSFLYFLSICITTVFGVGLIPIAPGTFGSLVPLAILHFSGYPITCSYIIWILFACFISAFLFIPVVLHHTNETNKTLKQKIDPSFIVIDEVIGQLIAILCIALYTPLSLQNMLYAFIAFRAFDIIKPWPIRSVEQTLGSLPRWQTAGVIFDDVLAGILGGGAILFYLYFFAN